MKLDLVRLKNYMLNRLIQSLPKLNELRRELLGNFCLNISAISFGVALFENNWLGFFPFIAGIWLFFIITKRSK